MPKKNREGIYNLRKIMFSYPLLTNIVLFIVGNKRTNVINLRNLLVIEKFQYLIGSMPIGKENCRRRFEQRQVCSVHWLHGLFRW
jgi:hypothetical protein